MGHVRDLPKRELGVDEEDFVPTYQVLAEKKGHDVVAVPTFPWWNVDLDPIVEAEQPLGSLSLPDDRIEGREERRRVDPMGNPCAAPQESRLAPSLDPYPPQVQGPYPGQAAWL